MPLQTTHYHQILRVASVVLALVLLFDSGLLSPSTAKLSSDTQRYIATAVGMSAGVQPTELNQYTTALTKRENELDAREASLEAREIEVRLAENGKDNQSSTFIIASVLFILLLLILLNYALDYLRTRKEVGEIYQKTT